MSLENEFDDDICKRKTADISYQGYQTENLNSNKTARKMAIVG